MFRVIIWSVPKSFPVRSHLQIRTWISQHLKPRPKPLFLTMQRRNRLKLQNVYPWKAILKRLPRRAKLWLKLRPPIIIIIWPRLLTKMTHQWATVVFLKRLLRPSRISKQIMVFGIRRQWLMWCPLSIFCKVLSVLEGLLTELIITLLFWVVVESKKNRVWEVQIRQI